MTVRGKPSTMFHVIFFIALAGTLLSCEGKVNVDTDTAEANHAEESEPVSMGFMISLWQKDIVFYARGNEPFWALDIYKDHTARFYTLDGIDVTTKYTQGDNANMISVENDTALLTITRADTVCQDNMSGREFPYSVRVVYSDKLSKIISEYVGCGAYVPDPRLHNKWQLTMIDGQLLDSSQLSKGLPVLNFSITGNSVSGHDGCNQISGNIRLDKDSILFGNLISTKMYCPDMGAAEKLGALLSGRKYNVEIYEGELRLIDSDRPVMVFRNLE